MSPKGGDDQRRRHPQYYRPNHIYLLSPGVTPGENQNPLVP
jgi:hypothetical protein